jgi:hypothetical protein
MKSTVPAHRSQAAERFHNLSRRRFLHGLGACLALPAMESLLPGRLAAAPTMADGALTGAVTASGAPLRTAFLYFPNGAIPASWWPATGEGKNFELNKTMAPLAKVKDQIQIVKGLTDLSALGGADGGGDHARAGGTFLTSVRIKKTGGADFHAGVSVDQVMAQQVGQVTPFRSLELSCDTIQNAGECDSGYACIYQHNLAWSSATSPISPETNPRLLFERLFGTGTPDERKQNMRRRQEQQRSILDFISGETRTIGRELSARDNQKLDEYLTGVREIEQRIERAEKASTLRPAPGIATPAGIPASFTEYTRLNLDMLHLAFLTDNTRVATFLFAGDGSNRDFAEIGVPEGHHFCTHHHNSPDLIAKTAVIDHFYVSQLAYFLEKMQQTKDMDGRTLLDNSMIVYGSGNADGNRHTHTDLPVILAGGGGGTLQAGRFVKNEDTSIANLYLSLMDRMGVPKQDRFGDSTGRLTTI